jgi:hypothetical protein
LYNKGTVHWDEVDGPLGGVYDNELTWTYSMRPTGDNDRTRYFDTIEHNLNMAVYYCAAALNFVLNYAGYTDCNCKGDWPSEGDDDTQEVKDRADVKLIQDEFTGLFFFSMTGLMATGVALALLSKISILEKFGLN